MTFFSLIGFIALALVNTGLMWTGYRLRRFIRSEVSMLKLTMIGVFSLVFTAGCFAVDSGVAVLMTPISSLLAGMIVGSFFEPAY